MVSRRNNLREDQDWQSHFIEIYYRAFDIRNIFYHPDVIELPRYDIMRHLTLGDNIALNTNRQVNSNFRHILCTKRITTDCTISGATRERSNAFPLYLYPTEDATQQKSLFDVSLWPGDAAHGGRTPNLNPAFVAEMEETLGLVFRPHPRHWGRRAQISPPLTRGGN